MNTAEFNGLEINGVILVSTTPFRGYYFSPTPTIMSAFQLGQTDVTVYFRAYNTADGSERTDLAHGTTGLALGYVRERSAEVEAIVGGSPAPVSLAADNTAHTDWGFRAIVGNLYRADFPDAMCAASGAPRFVIPYARLTGVTFVQVSGDDLTGADLRATNLNAQVKGMDANVLTASAVATDAVTEIQSGLATSTALATVAGYLDTEVAAILAAVDTEIAAIKAKTDNLPASPAATGAEMAPTSAARLAIVNAVVRAANGADGYVITKDVDNSRIVLTIPGVGDVNIPATFSDISPAVVTLGE